MKTLNKPHARSHHGRGIFNQFSISRWLSLSILICVLLVAAPPQPGLARTPENDFTYPFSAFGYQNRTLYGPFDTETFTFGIPHYWELQSPLRIDLNLDVYIHENDISGASSQKADPALFGGFLEIRFNNQLIESVQLTETGEINLELEIPETAFQPAYSLNRHVLDINLRNEEYCLFDIQTTVVVQPISRLIIPHTQVDPDFSLTKLPWPIFQPDAMLEQTAVMIIPDQPTQADLQAALMVSAGLGRMTGGELRLVTVQESRLSILDRDSQPLIYVGQYDHFNTAETLEGTPALSALVTQFPEDGILQISPSPWKSIHPVLAVTGSSPLGVTKGARAFASGKIFGSIYPTAGIVKNISPYTYEAYPPIDRTLAELGYDSDIISRAGVIRRTFDFYLPPGTTAERDAYFELHYTHSSFLNVDQSGLVIYLNESPINSTRFGQETSAVRELQSALPPELLKPGLNHIQVEADLEPPDICAGFLQNQMWLSIQRDSLLHLPLSEVTTPTGDRTLDIANYPAEFGKSPSPGAISFILPKSSPAAWDVSTKISFDLGNRTGWPLHTFAVHFADDLNRQDMDSRDVFFIGQAKDLPSITEYAGILPAPFQAGSNLPDMEKLEIAYHIDSTMNIGLLEIFPSPWNAERSALAILGTTDQGLYDAAGWLFDPGSSGSLYGNYAVLHQDQALTGFSMPTSPPDDTQGDSPLLTQEEITPLSTGTGKKMGWIAPVFAGVVLLIPVMIAVGFLTTSRDLRPVPERDN